MMISKEELNELIGFESAGRVLSVYLNVNQAESHNLNRGFEVELRNILNGAEASVRGEAKEEFASNVEAVKQFAAEHKPLGKTLVVFSRAAAGFFWSRSLDVPLGSSAHWGSQPYIRPLIEARDEYERYGVLLADRAQARLYIIYMNEIEIQQEAEAELDVRKFDASSKDQSRSQMRFQHKQEEHVRRHLKHVAGLMEHLAERKAFDRLVLGGPTEALSELQHVLPDRLKERVIGTVSLSLEVSEQEILKQTRPLLEEYERTAESRLIEVLITDAAKEQRAVVGVLPTVRAASEGRIQQLVYADDFAADQGALNEAQDFLSGRQGARPEGIGNGLSTEALHNWMIHRVVSTGGTIEQVRGAAAERLRGSGGIGAIIRF